MMARTVRLSKSALCTAVLILGFLMPMAASAETTITFWYWAWANMDRTVDRLVEVFEARHPDIKVESTSWNSMDKFLVNALAGTTPDVIVTGGGQLSQLTPQTFFVPLDDYIEQTPAVRDNIIPFAWEAGDIDGHIWLIPGIEWGPRDAFVWNKTLFDEAGLPGFDPDTPPTWEQVATYNTRLARQGGDGLYVQLGYLPTEGRNSDLDVLEFALDASWWNAQTQEFQVNSPAYIEALQYIYDTFFAPFPSTMGTTSTWYRIASGQTAMANLGYYAPGELRNRAPQYEYGFTWHPTKSGERSSGVGGWGVAMPLGASTDAAWKFITFLTTDMEAFQILFEEMGYFPASLEFFQNFRSDDPGVNWFVQAVAANQWSSPSDGRPGWGRSIVNTPILQAMQQVYSGRMPAATALEAMQVFVEAEVQRFLGEQ